MRNRRVRSTVAMVRTFVFISNLPLGVSIIREGGRNGYSAGRTIRKWYNPPSMSVPGGHRMVQCHSYYESESGGLHLAALYSQRYHPAVGGEFVELQGMVGHTENSPRGVQQCSPWKDHLQAHAPLA